MIRPGTNDALTNGQYAQMGNYIIMPQAALSGNQLSAQNQFRQIQQYHQLGQQLGPQHQQFILPQGLAGQFPLANFPFLQSAMVPAPMLSTHPSQATHLVQHPAYTQRTNKLRPKASENIKLPHPLPECIEKMNVPSELYCPVCELSVNSQQQLTQHLGSTKHKLVSLGLLPKPSEDPNIKRVGQYKCKTCDVILNSEAQLVQHLKSLRHQAAERGEDLPPRGERRFCPYSRNSPKKSPSSTGTGTGIIPNMSDFTTEILGSPRKADDCIMTESLISDTLMTFETPMINGTGNYNGSGKLENIITSNLLNNTGNAKIGTKKDSNLHKISEIQSLATKDTIGNSQTSS